MYYESKISKIEIKGMIVNVWHNEQRFDLRNYDRFPSAAPFHVVNWDESLYEKAGLVLAKL